MSITSFIPAASSSGGTNINLAISSAGHSSFTLPTAQPAGVYSITSMSGDASYDVYLSAGDNTAAGNASTSSSATSTIIATQPFINVVIYGNTPNDTLKLEAKPTVFSSVSGNFPGGVAPYVSSITSIDSASLTVYGGNFSTSPTVTFTGTNSVAITATTVTRVSSTQLTVTRPASLTATYTPYQVAVFNGSIPPAQGSIHVKQDPKTLSLVFYTTSQSITVTGSTQFLMSGGGGGGAGGFFTTNGWNGGGSGYITSGTVSAGTYSLVVGAGGLGVPYGQTTSSGGATTFAGYTANGGAGGDQGGAGGSGAGGGTGLGAGSSAGTYGGTNGANGATGIAGSAVALSTPWSTTTAAGSENLVMGAGFAPFPGNNGRQGANGGKFYSGGGGQKGTDNYFMTAATNVVGNNGSYGGGGGAGGGGASNNPTNNTAGEVQKGGNGGTGFLALLLY